MTARDMLKKAQLFFGLNRLAGQNAGGFWASPGSGQSAPPINRIGSSSGRDVSIDGALSLSAAWACIWLTAETIASMPFQLMERKSGQRIGTPITDNPLGTVISQRPNPQMDAISFWMFILASRLLWGNGYARISRNGSGDCFMLDPLRPEYMKPYLSPKTGALRYAYVAPEGGSGDFAASEIFHSKWRSLDGLVGVSPIGYARNSLGIAQAADLATADTFRNGLRVGGMVKYPRFLTTDQRDQVRGHLDEFRTGEERAAGFFVLEGGADFAQITMNPQDAQLLSSRQFAVEDVCRWYNTPPVLVGHAAQGVTAWGTGIEQLLSGWLALSIRPTVRKLTMEIGTQLVRPEDLSRFFAWVDTDDLLAADSESRSQLYSSYAQNGVYTRNEIREKENKAPLPGGDVLTVQSNLVPLEKLGELGAQPTEAVPQVADKPAKPGQLRAVA